MVFGSRSGTRHSWSRTRQREGRRPVEIPVERRTIVPSLGLTFRNLVPRNLMEHTFADLGGASVVIDKFCCVVDYGAPQFIRLPEDKVLHPTIQNSRWAVRSSYVKNKRSVRSFFDTELAVAAHRMFPVSPRGVYRAKYKS